MVRQQGRRRRTLRQSEGGVTETVPTPEAALEQLGLRADTRVKDFNAAERRAFRRLIGWDAGGPVVAYPTPPEQAARQRREQWKTERAGQGQAQPCLRLRAGNLRTFRANATRDPATARWQARLLQRAAQVAQLPPTLLEQIIPAQGPWNVAGSFCPHCVGEKSDYTIHHPFWRWSPLAPEQIQCPHCGIRYPHPDYPEEGRLELPRLGLTYAFYLSPREQQSADWRDGRQASSFGGAPTHVSLSGEVRSCALAWALGQVEPLSVAYALTGEARYAQAVAVILGRLATVYPHYPMYSYRQEYADAEPAYAEEQVDTLPTPFKRAAFHYTYSGRWGDLTDLHGKQETTAAVSAYPNGEWGSSRLGREKASNGQLFLSLFKAYDLIKETLAAEERTRIERDFLLELYLDTRELSRHCDNKSGPGAASRVAVGVFYADAEEREAGLEQFRQVIQGQFYEDGSWKETPIYGAKSLFEGMAEIPELLRGQVDLYADPLYGNAFATYARVGTPLGTQPALGDSPAGYCLQTYLGDLARIRLGVDIPPAPARLQGFALLRPESVYSASGYVPGLECIGVPADDEEDLAQRAGRQDDEPGDAGECVGESPTGEDSADDLVHLQPLIGFAEVGNSQRRVGSPSVLSMFTEQRPPRPVPPREALNHYFSGRGLACLGWGVGQRAVQLYVNGDDGRSTHRHADPLSLTLFAFGRELLPDLGYIADHAANAWLRSTAAHNTVAVDGGSVRAMEAGTLRGWDVGDNWRFCALSVPVAAPGGGPRLAVFRRAVVLLRLPGEGLVLVDLFAVEGGETRDYLVRVNDPERHFQVFELPATLTRPDSGVGMGSDRTADLTPAAAGETATADATPMEAEAATGAERGDTLRGPQCHPRELAFTPRAAALFQDVATPPWGFRSGGACTGGLVASWGTDLRINAHVLSPCAEVIHFQSPAWRDSQEVFADPRRSWDTLCLRQEGVHSRFAVIYEVVPDGLARRDAAPGEIIGGAGSGDGDVTVAAASAPGEVAATAALAHGAAALGDHRPTERQQPPHSTQRLDVALVALQPRLTVRLRAADRTWEISLDVESCRVTAG